MNILTVESLSKSYGDRTLFQQISFSIAEKERIGLIGTNGTGKSTLLNIIAGVDQPDQGSILHARGFRIEYLPQNPTFQSGKRIIDHIYHGDSPLMNLLREYESTVTSLEKNENVEENQKKLLDLQQQMEAHNAWDIVSRAKAILSQLQIRNLQQQMDELSGGERKRVALAIALLHPADLLFLDEPTNHMDLETTKWLEDQLAKYSGSLFIVTHDRYFLYRVTNKIYELDRGHIYRYEGNYEYYLEKKAERIELEQASEEKRRNILRRELAWLQRGAKARTTKQKARIDRIEAMQKQGGIYSTTQLEMNIATRRLGKQIFDIESICKSFGEKRVVHNFSHIVLPGDRIGIIGANGSGKSTLLNMLAKHIEPDVGSINVGQTVRIAYYTQENYDLDDRKRVIEYIKEVSDLIRTKDGMEINATQMLERFQFPVDKQWLEIGRLSGGEKRRLFLLRTLLGQPNVLLLDEPTNDLDVQTLSILEEYIEEFPGVVITVTHDRYFLDRIADQLWVFVGDGHIHKFIGNYLEYAVNPFTSKLQSKIENQVEQKQKPSTLTTGPRKLSYKEQREWDEIESKIAALEEKSRQLSEQIALAGSNYEELQRLTTEEQIVQEQLNQAIERWTELSLLIEEIEKQKS